MLGQNPSQSLEDRGVLGLDKKVSWVASGSEVPPVEP
jgi:hypothetical protein